MSGMRLSPLDGDILEHNALLITGATGFIGMEILARYLERSERQIAVLVRAAGGTPAVTDLIYWCRQPVGA